MATTDDSSYRHLLAEYRKCDNYDSVFRSALDDLAGKLDLDWVRSCVAFGAGSGEHEIEFARRLLPNLTRFTAVEPDHESVKALRRGTSTSSCCLEPGLMATQLAESVKALRSNFRNAQLSGVETTIAETSVENWSGVEKPVDVALFFNVIFHVDADARQLLLRRLKMQYLNPDGIVVIVENGSPATSAFIRLMHSLGYPQDNWYGDIEKEVLACGFCIDSAHDIVSIRDLSEPTEGVVKYIQLLFDDNAMSEQRIRAAISKTYADPNPEVKHVVRKMGIFRKSS